MANTSAFDWLCAELESSTSFDRLESRGTVRLALKEAGLDVKTASAEQLAVVVERILPEELRRRGVDDADSVCAGLATGLKRMGDGGAASDTPEAVFARLGGS